MTNEKNSLIWLQIRMGEGQGCWVGKKKQMEGDKIKRVITKVRSRKRDEGSMTEVCLFGNKVRQGQKGRGGGVKEEQRAG